MERVGLACPQGVGVGGGDGRSGLPPGDGGVGGGGDESSVCLQGVEGERRWEVLQPPEEGVEMEVSALPPGRGAVAGEGSPYSPSVRRASGTWAPSSAPIVAGSPECRWC